MLLQRTPAPPTELSASEPCRSLKKPRWLSPAPSQAAKVPGGVAERVGGVVAERVGAPDIVSPPPAPTPADVAQPLSNSRRPPANPGQGSFKRRQRSCGRARRGAPIPRHPAACLRQRAPPGWRTESQACCGMGQQTSKERQRLREIRRLLSKADETLPGLIISRATEAAAGIPAAPGSAQARYNAAFDNDCRLTDE